MLNVELTKTSPTHHRFRIVRANGEVEFALLETKTYLFHDLLHFALESEAKLGYSFYGKLALGLRYAELTQPEIFTSDLLAEDEAAMTERIVGVMTGVLKSDARLSDAIASLADLLGASGNTFPRWFTEEFVINVKERMRKLEGKWKGTPFGSTMVLSFTA